MEMAPDACSAMPIFPRHVTRPPGHIMANLFSSDIHVWSNRPSLELKGKSRHCTHGNKNPCVALLAEIRRRLYIDLVALLFGVCVIEDLLFHGRINANAHIQQQSATWRVNVQQSHELLIEQLGHICYDFESRCETYEEPLQATIARLEKMTTENQHCEHDINEIRKREEKDVTQRQIALLLRSGRYSTESQGTPLATRQLNVRTGLTVPSLLTLSSECAPA